MRRGATETVMAIYLVDFSLRAMDHDYAPLWGVMQKAGAQRAMDTTWFVDVQQSVGELTNALLSHIRPRDRLLVVEIATNAGWSATAMDDETKDWLKRRMKVLMPAAKPVEDQSATETQVS